MVNGGFHVEFLCIPLFNASKLPQQIESRWWCPKGHPQKALSFFISSRSVIWLVVDLALWRMMEWTSVGIYVGDDDMSNWMEKNMFQTTNQLYMITDWPWGYREFVPNLFQRWIQWITMDYVLWNLKLPNGSKWVPHDRMWFFMNFPPNVLQQGNLGIISSRSAYWSYFASQISQLDLGSCLISGKPCSITFKSFDFVFGVHHTGFRRMCDTKPTRPLQKVQHLEARASLQVKLQLMNMGTSEVATKKLQF